MRRQATGQNEIRLVQESQFTRGARPRRRFRRVPSSAITRCSGKSFYTGGPRGLARCVGFILTVIGGGFLVYYSVELGSAAIIEMWNFGRPSESNYAAWANRRDFMMFVRLVVPLIYVIAILAVAGAAAASMTSEHEEDTWVSLTATDLSGREIVFAKMLGAMRRGRGFGELIILLAVIAAVAGSISPLAIPLLIVAMVVYALAAGALGIWISLQLRSTWRSQFLTMACLLLINVLGQGVLNMLSKLSFAPQLWPGFTPYEVDKLLIDTDFIDQLTRAQWPRSWWVSSMNNEIAWQTISSVVSVVAYTALAGFLVWHSLYLFEIAAGRARRSKLPQPIPPGPPDRQNAMAINEQNAIASAVA